MIEAVQNFLQLFQEGTPAEERTPQHLAVLLDCLLLAYHKTADICPDSKRCAPSHDYKASRILMVSCFPDFGFYAWVEPGETPDSEIMMGDAIDDLADIYDDLLGVVWLWKNSSEADAVWQFRNDYQGHWGRHLLNLRSYLHWKLYEV